MTGKLLLLAMLGAAVGCVDNRSSVSVAGRAFPSDTASGCIFSPDGQFTLGPGQLNIDRGSTYRTVLYVDNAMADPVNNPPGTTTSAASWRATAARTRVNPSDYTDKFPGPLLAVRGENRLPLDGHTIAVGARAPIVVDVLGPALGASVVAAASVPSTIVVGVTLEGFTLGGTRVDSGEFYFGIEICDNTTCGVPACKATEVIASCFGSWQDPLFCFDPG